MKKKRLGTVVLVIVLIIGCIGVSAEARAISSSYVSAACRTDGWTSFEDDVVVTMTSQKDSPQNTDAGMSLTAGNVGLPGGFIESPARQLHTCVMEQDEFLSADDEVYYYYGQFGIGSDGRYKIIYYNPDVAENHKLGVYSIESSNVLELYIEAYIDPISGDPSDGHEVTQGIFIYSFWCD